MNNKYIIYSAIIAGILLLTVNIYEFSETHKYSGIVSSMFLIVALVLTLIEKNKKKNFIKIKIALGFK